MQKEANLQYLYWIPVAVLIGILAFAIINNKPASFSQIQKPKLIGLSLDEITGKYGTPTDTKTLSNVNLLIWKSSDVYVIAEVTDSSVRAVSFINLNETVSEKNFFNKIGLPFPTKNYDSTYSINQVKPVKVWNDYDNEVSLTIFYNERNNLDYVKLAKST